MKNVFILLLLFSSFNSISQSDKLRALLDKGELSAIKEYYAKGNDLFDYLLIPREIYGDVELMEVHPIIYVTNKENMQLVNFYLDEMKKYDGGIEQFAHEINAAFVMSMSGNNEEIKTLLHQFNNSKADVCYPCHSQTAIMVAAAYGNEKWYFKLKEEGFEDFLSENGSNLLHCAVNGGSVKILNDVLNQNRFDINGVNQEYLPKAPIDFSIDLDSDEIFNLLLKTGADINSSGSIFFGLSEVKNSKIQEYIMANADISRLLAIDYYNEMPLHHAMRANNSGVVLWMLKKMKEFCTEGFIFEYGAFEDTEYHPLLYAIENQNKEIFEAFIEFATFMNKCNDFEIIPFYKYLSKSANKTFGKSYVKEVYTKYGVQETK